MQIDRLPHRPVLWISVPRFVLIKGPTVWSQSGTLRFRVFSCAAASLPCSVNSQPSSRCDSGLGCRCIPSLLLHGIDYGIRHSLVSPAFFVVDGAVVLAEDFPYEIAIRHQFKDPAVLCFRLHFHSPVICISDLLCCFSRCNFPMVASCPHARQTVELDRNRRRGRRHTSTRTDNAPIERLRGHKFQATSGEPLSRSPVFRAHFRDRAGAGKARSRGDGRLAVRGRQQARSTPVRDYPGLPAEAKFWLSAGWAKVYLGGGSDIG